MRDDQVALLEDLGNELIDVVLEEADPKLWPGYRVPLAEMSKEDRGDRYWCKKNAAATLALATKVQSLLEMKKRPDWKPSAGEQDELDDEIAGAVKEAESRLKALQDGKGKTGKRTH